MFKKENAQAFLLVLILLGMGAAMIIPFVRIAGTAVKNRQIYGQFINEDYAADAAIEYGMWRLKYEPDFAENLPVGEACDPFWITLNGIEASTTVLAQAPTGELSGQDLGGRAEDELYFKVEKDVSATATFATLAADGFESHSVSGGTGAWLGNWTMTGYYSFTTSGEHEGSYCLLLQGDDNSYPGDGYVKREVNLSGSVGDGPYLKFWARVNQFENGDYAYLKVSTNGTDWTTLRTFSNSDDDNQWHSYQFDLSSYGTPSSFFIAFQMDCSYYQDYLYIDDIKFTNSQETTVIEPGVLTEYTYNITIQCMDPDG
jgi:hypothetical protein